MLELNIDQDINILLKIPTFNLDSNRLAENNYEGHNLTWNHTLDRRQTQKIELPSDFDDFLHTCSLIYVLSCCKLIKTKK